MYVCMYIYDMYTMKQCGRLLLALTLRGILSVPDVSSDKFFIWLRFSRCAGCDYAYCGWLTGTSCEFFAFQCLCSSVRYTGSIVCVDRLRHASTPFGMFMHTTVIRGARDWPGCLRYCYCFQDLCIQTQDL